MHFGLAKGYLQLLMVLEGGCIFMLKMDMLSTVCTDLLDDYL